MKKNQALLIPAVLVYFMLLGFTVQAVVASEQAPRMSKEALKGELNNPELVVVDVRTAGSWDKSELKIQGAVKEDPDRTDTWMGKYPNTGTLVFYCS